MMSGWDEVLSNISAVLNNLNEKGCTDPFFRGHSESHWKLSPGMTRWNMESDDENRLYYGFVSLGGYLLQDNATTWDTLFMMQHHGLPTRLLDWSGNFAVALYFALKGCASEGAVWVLDPYDLNQRTIKVEEVAYLSNDFSDDYLNYFIEQRSKSFGRFPASVVAIGGSSYAARMRSQRGVFTLHNEIQQPLEDIFPEVVHKIVIPEDAIEGAKQFLRLAGVNEYTLFPDLDGLSRYLIDTEFGDA
jgi:hypothetical protein